jgi:uncharacterized membrane protein YgcG
MDAGTIVWIVATIIVTGVVWWVIASAKRRDTEAQSIVNRGMPRTEAAIAEVARQREAFGPNTQAALNRKLNATRRKHHGDLDDEWDDELDAEDLVDAIQTVMVAGDRIAEEIRERHPDFPNVARDGLEGELAPTYDPPPAREEPVKVDRSYEQAPAYREPEPDRSSSYSSGSSDSGYDSGSSDSGGGSDD